MGVGVHEADVAMPTIHVPAGPTERSSTSPRVPVNGFGVLNHPPWQDAGVTEASDGSAGAVKVVATRAAARIAPATRLSGRAEYMAT